MHKLSTTLKDKLFYAVSWSQHSTDCLSRGGYEGAGARGNFPKLV